MLKLLTKYIIIKRHKKNGYDMLATNYGVRFARHAMKVLHKI